MADLNEQPSVEFQGIQTLLQEAHDTVEAIRAGVVDGFVITSANGGEEVFILEGANQPYRLFVEQMNDGAVTLSNDAIVLYANKYFADIMKTPLEQIIGAPFEDFLVDKDLLQRVMTKTDPGNLEAELLASNGTRLPVYISYSPLRNGNNSWICLVIMDDPSRNSSRRCFKRANVWRQSVKLQRCFLMKLPTLCLVCSPWCRSCSVES